MRTFNTFKNDIRKTWSLINETLNRKAKSQTIQEYIINNRKISNMEEIADTFNEYFINIGRLLSEKIQPSGQYDDYLNNHTISRFHFTPVDENTISRFISNLKNKSSFGHDNISNILLKKSKEVLIQPLTLLINQTLSTGIFPNELKISRVKPLYKNGEVSQICNYRPISLLPSLSKIFEYVIFHQLFSYMENNKLLSCEQFGFRSGHSTELAALRLIDHLIKQMDQHFVPINIYIDLSKAFDTLDHNILLSKLSYYGVAGPANALFRSYLSDRRQYVDFNGILSNTQVIYTGVPQGSILGPLLFLIYINDLPSVSNIFNMLMYADDTTLYCNIGNETTEHDINIELSKVYRWLSSNKLSINVKKSKFMVFHTNQRQVTYPKLIINNREIERVTQFNFLGLILSSNLKWHHHINHISLKISRVIGIMYRIKDIYPESILLMIYNALIFPHFNYCLLAWGSKVIEGHKIHLFQKKALRIITNNEYLAHTEPICKNLRLVKVIDMYRLSLWKFYYKLMNNTLPYYFEIMKPELPRISDRYEIRKPTFHLPKINHEFAEQLLKYRLIVLLNNENRSISITAKVHTHSFEGFKLYIKNEVIDSYIANL